MAPQLSPREAVKALLSGRSALPALPASEQSARSEIALASSGGAVPAAAVAANDDPHQHEAAPEASVIHLAVGRSARSNRITSQHVRTFAQLIEVLQGRPAHVGQLTLEQYLTLKGARSSRRTRPPRTRTAPG